MILTLIPNLFNIAHTPVTRPPHTPLKIIYLGIENLCKIPTIGLALILMKWYSMQLR